MINKITSVLFLFFCMITSMSIAQIEELEPIIQIETETATEEVSTSNNDYNDTWRTPYIQDEMTKDPDQNASWKLGEYKYNSRPKDSWEVGIHGGHFFIDGDVDRRIPGGWGAGLHIRKAINYIFSIRASAFYGVAQGIENQPWFHSNVRVSENEFGGLVESSFDVLDPEAGGPGVWFPAHKTTYILGDLAVVFNIGNLLFHQERNKWNWYGALGVGLDSHNTKLDLLDGTTPYNDLISRVDFTRERFDTKAGRDDIEGRLDEIYDGVFETDGFQKAGIYRIGDDINIHVVFVPSMGISRKITKRINVGIEHSVFLSDNDYLDGIKFRLAGDQTNNVDISHYTHLRVGLNIGNFDRVTEPLYWLNPYDAAFSDIAKLKSEPALDLTDEDNDGVLDIIDQQLDTPEDCAVDTRGVLLDSDGDGIVDCEDKEPYSQPGCPIDEFGVAQCEEECCATEESINKLIDAKTETMREEFFGTSSNYGGSGSGATRLETRTITNPDGTTRTETVVVPVPGGGGSGSTSSGGSGRTSSGGSGRTSSGGSGSSVVNNRTYNNVRTGCGEWFLPMIHFDLNKSNIKPEYFSHLHNVAQVLAKCPEVCVTAQGHTDTRNSNDYNRVLSYKRAKSAVDYLTENYGIDRSRIKLMYGGEENPMVSAPNSEAHHFMNRRVEFRTCDATDFDMAQPEGYIDSSSGYSPDPAKSEYYNGNKSSGY